jgi:hypothetical protein
LITFGGRLSFTVLLSGFLFCWSFFGRADTGLVREDSLALLSRPFLPIVPPPFFISFISICAFFTSLLAARLVEPAVADRS